VHRVEATAKVLKQFATGGFQVLLFTCHEHIAQIFHSLDMEVRELPSNTEIGATATKPPEVEAEVEPIEPEEIEIEEAPIEIELMPEEPFVPAPEPVAIDIEFDDTPRPRPIPRPAPKPVPAPVAVEPEPIPEPPRPKPQKPKPQRPQRVRRRRAGPFANAIWHEHVEEDVEIQRPAIGGNGHGTAPWDDEEDTHAYDDAFGELHEEPEDIEAA